MSDHFCWKIDRVEGGWRSNKNVEFVRSVLNVIELEKS